MVIKKTKNNIRVLFIVVLAGFLISAPLYKAYAVFITPVFVSFDKNRNAAQITLNNRSNQSKVITFEWERRVLNEQGQSILLQEGQTAHNYRPVDPYIKFSPRRVILKPKQHQVVRLVAQRPRDLPPGEYRSHLLIKEEGLTEKGLPRSSQQQGLSGHVIVDVNKSIPVFLRQGDTTVNVTLEQASIKLRGGRQYLSITLGNDSTRSVYANIYLNCKKSGEAMEWRVMPLRIYAERDHIQKTVVLADDVDLDGCDDVVASVKVRNDYEFGGKSIASGIVSR